MNSASKVGEIFVEAGEAFNRLGNLTIQLQQASPNATNSGKWREEEIEMLHEAVKRFGPDPQKISETLKSRSVSQIRNALKTKAFEGAHTQGATAAARPAERAKQKASLVAKSDVTLNMLNAGVPEADVEEMGEGYFDGPTEEVS